MLFGVFPETLVPESSSKYVSQQHMHSLASPWRTVYTKETKQVLSWKAFPASIKESHG